MVSRVSRGSALAGRVGVRVGRRPAVTATQATTSTWHARDACGSAAFSSAAQSGAPDGAVVDLLCGDLGSTVEPTDLLAGGGVDLLSFDTHASGAGDVDGASAGVEGHSAGKAGFQDVHVSAEAAKVCHCGCVFVPQCATPLTAERVCACARVYGCTVGLRSASTSCENSVATMR